MRRHHLSIGGRAITLIEGPAGWGECSPLPGYACDPAAAMRSAEEAARDGFPTHVRTRVAVNALVQDASFDPDSLREFAAVKVKLRDPADVELVARVRDVVGPHVALRVDANGAFDVETAVSVLERVARFDVELAEQPVPTLDELAAVRRRTPIPLAADECVRSVDDARRLRALGAADVVVLKVQPLGGVRAALAVAEAAGVPALPTSMLETSVGLAAGLALACALPELPFAVGLGTAGVLGGDVTAAPLVPEDGALEWRPIVPDADLLARYAADSRSSQAVIS